MLHRQQVVAGGDARAARWITSSGARPPRRAANSSRSRGRCLEGAAVAEVVAVEAVEGARDVAGDRIDRLGLAAKALAAARVDDRAARRAASRQPAASTLGASDGALGVGRGAAPAPARPGRSARRRHAARPARRRRARRRRGDRASAASTTAARRRRRPARRARPPASRGRCRAPRSSARTHRGSGSGWRPLRPVFAPLRSRSR